MRIVGVCAVILGLAALGVVAIDVIRTVAGAPVDRATDRDGAVALQRLIAWVAVVGIAASATVAGGVGALLRSLLWSRRGDAHVDPPAPSDGDVAAMIDAEVNEGGPPSPIPCDTPVAYPAPREAGQTMGENSPIIETCPAPDRILRLPIGEGVGAARSATLLKSAGLELIRLVIPAGREIPTHRAPGEITVQCIEGHVAFEHDGLALDMRPGDLVYLCPQEIHALKGIADSSVLVTRLRPHVDELPETFPGN